MWQALLDQSIKGDFKSLARSISLIENEAAGYEDFLASLPHLNHAQLIGITGPPGAGKSTLVDGLIEQFVNKGKKLAVLCIDPSSPFNLGSVLGDRIRMSQWYTHPHVFIRSLATRGSMGGLHPKILEISELVKVAGFDYIIIETVGVGQSEIEIAGLADCTIVVLVPEAGDEVQTMKAGLMEIADIFVVNKSDRPDAETFVRNLQLMLAPAFTTSRTRIPIIKTIGSEKKGLEELVKAIELHGQQVHVQERKYWLQTEKVWNLIQQSKMKGLNKELIFEELKSKGNHINLYQYARKYF